MTDNFPSDAPTQYRAVPDSYPAPAAPVSPAGAAGSSAAGRAIFAVVAVIALIALTAGVTWLVTAPSRTETAPDDTAAFTQIKTGASAQSSESTATSEPSRPSRAVSNTPAPVATTSAAAQPDKCGAAADAVIGQVGNPVGIICDGDWLFFAQGRSTSYYLYSWSGTEWTSYAPHGRAEPSHISCWDRGTLDKDGVPSEILSDIPLCATDKPAGDSPVCDGRWVLIVDSLLIPPGQSPQPEIDRVQAYYSGAKVMPGSTCSSLRDVVDGKQVYAVYYEAGHSVDEVCTLKARHGGGNARSLNNDADFTDPC